MLAGACADGGCASARRAERDAMQTDASIALYLHIPFCASKCAYCDFASYPGMLERLPGYLHALAEELRLRAAQYGRRPLHSVFIGGGTPTLLAGEQLAGLMEAVHTTFDVRRDAEITMEGNPGMLRPGDIAVYRQAGVNRFSLGAQAAQEALLASLGRAHRWPQVQSGVSMLRAAGVENLNLDLMFGLPGQTLEDWRQTLEAALALRPEHLSCYGLQVEEDTPLHARIQCGEGLPLPDEETERAMYDETLRRLAQAGLEQYEVSNFARPGKQCIQNRTYWTRGEYLGIGCAAHSMMGEQRFGNPRDLAMYLAAIRQGEDPTAERTVLGEAEARFETLMLGLRLTRGVSIEEFVQRFGVSPEAVWGDRLRSLKKEGLLEVAEGYLRLTRRGFDVQNYVLVALM